MKLFKKSWYLLKGKAKHAICTKFVLLPFFFSLILSIFFLLFAFSHFLAFSIKHKSRWQHPTWKNESKNTSAIIPACSVGRFGINCWRTVCVTEVQFPQVRPHLVSRPFLSCAHHLSHTSRVILITIIFNIVLNKLNWK